MITIVSSQPNSKEVTLPKRTLATAVLPLGRGGSVNLGMKSVQRRDTKWELSPGGCISVYGVSYRLRTLWSLCLLPHPVAVGFSDVCHCQAPIDKHQEPRQPQMACQFHGKWGASKDTFSFSGSPVCVEHCFLECSLTWHPKKRALIVPFRCEGSEGQRGPLQRELEVKFPLLESLFPLPPAASDSDWRNPQRTSSYDCIKISSGVTRSKERNKDPNQPRLAMQVLRMQSQAKTQVLAPGSNLVPPEASSSPHGPCNGVWTLGVNLLEGTRVPMYLVIVGADVGNDPRHSYQDDNVDL